MKYFLFLLLTFFSIDALAKDMSPEQFTYTVVSIMEQHDQVHQYFLIMKSNELKTVYACRSAKKAVEFVDFVYENPTHLHLIDPLVLKYMQDNLEMYKPFLSNYCKF